MTLKYSHAFVDLKKYFNVVKPSILVGHFLKFKNIVFTNNSNYLSSTLHARICTSTKYMEQYGIFRKKHLKRQ